MKLKYVLGLIIISIAILLLNTGVVSAKEVSDYKCLIEEGEYILCNDYFNTNDVKVEKVQIYETGEYLSTYNINNVPQATFNDIITKDKNQNAFLCLVKVSNDATSVKCKEGNTEKELEIVELNGKKYVALDSLYIDNTSSNMLINAYQTLKIVKNGATEETKQLDFSLNIYSTDYFMCTIKVVDDEDLDYGQIINTNGIISGAGTSELPEKINLSNTYVEYLCNQYIGKSIQVDCLGEVPYIGKVGNEYKYKINLKNVKIDNSESELELKLGDFSYKGSTSLGASFYLPSNYINEDETNDVPDNDIPDNNVPDNDVPNNIVPDNDIPKNDVPTNSNTTTRNKNTSCKG